MTTLTLEEQGETLIFFGEADSSAPQLTFEVHLAPGASGPASHFHPKQSERFSVVAGSVLVTIEGEEHRVEAGNELLIRAGQAHTFSNGSATESLVVRCTVEPALNFQWFLTEMARAAIRGGGRWDDTSLLDAGHMLHQIRGQYRLAGMPALVQTVVAGLLAGAALLLGRTRRISPRPAKEPALIAGRETA